MGPSLYSILKLKRWQLEDAGESTVLGGAQGSDGCGVGACYSAVHGSGRGICSGTVKFGGSRSATSGGSDGVHLHMPSAALGGHASSENDCVSGRKSGAGAYLSLSQIACIAADSFRALSHMHSIHLIHTDLKPENILLTKSIGRGDPIPSSPDVAIIDFGGATWHNEYHSSVVCTRQYRPPEVILGLPWSYPVDLWSMGCILAELWTGGLLFSTHDEIEHLALMERTLGALPRVMLRRVTGKRADRNFRNGCLRWPERAIDRESEEHVRSQRRLRDIIGADSRGEPLRWTQELADFHDLLLKLLEYTPEQRVTASAACQHPFILRAEP